MRIVKKAAIFIITFLIYHIAFGCNVFPIDENGVLQAPDWYPFLGTAISAIVTFVASNFKRIHIYKSINVPKIERAKVSTSEDDFELNKLNKYNSNFDNLFNSAVMVVFETGQASVSMLQRKLNIGYASAAKLIDEMEKFGIVGPFQGSIPRKILIKKEIYIERVKNGELKKIYSDSEKINIQKIIQEEQNWRKEQSGLPFSEYELQKIDRMEGHQFEYWCAALLKKIGFINVEVTKGSGDQGVDILAEKDGVKYAVQCKCYSSDLGNTPIQQVNTGKTIYHCQIGAVMTNRYFTQGGKEAAEATGVLLWDRDWIQKKLEEIKE